LLRQRLHKIIYIVLVCKLAQKNEPILARHSFELQGLISINVTRLNRSSIDTDLHAFKLLQFPSLAAF